MSTVFEKGLVVKNTFIDVVEAKDARKRSVSAPPVLRKVDAKPEQQCPAQPLPFQENKHPCQDDGVPNLNYTGATLIPQTNFELGDFIPPTPQASRRRRRRAARQPRPEPTFLSQIEQAGSTEEIFQIMPTTIQEISFDSIVTVLRVAAKKSLGGTQLQNNVGFGAAMQILERHLCNIDRHSLPKLFHSLGKLEAGGRSTSFIVHTASMIEDGLISFTEFSTPDLSNCLWGLAKMSCKPAKQKQEYLAIKLTEELQQRVDLTPQCMSMSVYSLALMQDKIAVGGQDTIAQFLKVCSTQISGNPQCFYEFTTQGISNTVWAFAKLKSSASQMSTKCLLVHARDASADRLDEFSPQELSSYAWAVTKLMERSHAKDWADFMSKIASVAGQKMESQSAQSVSNIALALNSVKALSYPQALRFLQTAAECASTRLADWKPQAISNFLYVLGQVPVRQRPALVSAGEKFSDEACLEYEKRQLEFSWQDLSGILSPVARAFGTPVSKCMATQVVVRARGRCCEMSTWIMLNIGLAACKLGVEKVDISPFLIEIDAKMARISPRFKAKDLEQLREIHHLMAS